MIIKYHSKLRETGYTMYHSGGNSAKRNYENQHVVVMTPCKTYKKASGPKKVSYRSKAIEDKLNALFPDKKKKTATMFCGCRLRGLPIVKYCPDTVPQQFSAPHCRSWTSHSQRSSMLTSHHIASAVNAGHHLGLTKHYRCSN
jgi:hypothetical protein